MPSSPLKPSLRCPPPSHWPLPLPALLPRTLCRPSLPGLSRTWEGRTGGEQLTHPLASGLGPCAGQKRWVQESDTLGSDAAQSLAGRTEAGRPCVLHSSSRDTRGRVWGTRRGRGHRPRMRSPPAGPLQGWGELRRQRPHEARLHTTPHPWELDTAVTTAPRPPAPWTHLPALRTHRPAPCGVRC